MGSRHGSRDVVLCWQQCFKTASRVAKSCVGHLTSTFSTRDDFPWTGRGWMAFGKCSLPRLWRVCHSSLLAGHRHWPSYSPRRATLTNFVVRPRPCGGKVHKTHLDWWSSCGASSGHCGKGYHAMLLVKAHLLHHVTTTPTCVVEKFMSWLTRR